MEALTEGFGFYDSFTLLIDKEKFPSASLSSTP
jgi:hypothetical protein